MIDLSPFLKASGDRLNGGKDGVWYDDGAGKITCSRAPRIGIDSHLLVLTEDAVSDLRLSVTVNSVDTGQHVPGSRHYDGRAEDIDEIHAYGGEPEVATLENPHAVAFVEHLISNGFVAGHENGPHAAVLFGPVGTKWNATDVDHSTHVHVSVWK